MGGDTSPVNILSDPGAWILFVSVLFLAEYIIILRLCYTLCDFVACNKSHAINRVLYHRYSRRFLSREINIYPCNKINVV